MVRDVGAIVQQVYIVIVWRGLWMLIHRRVLIL
jgi:hypothetical protein